VLSQFCRKCKGNYAGYIEHMWHFYAVKSAFLTEILSHFALTIDQKKGILARRTFPSQESIMSDEKLAALRQSHALHPHPDQVRDPLFSRGSPFFDPRDLVQVKYELLRRVRVDGDSVSHATSLFALSRPTFYAAQAAWERSGLLGLLPELTGPRHGHKLTDEIIAELQPLAKTMSAVELAVWLREQRSLSVHPRSMERALMRAAKKGGAS
jgi:transposase